MNKILKLKGQIISAISSTLICVILIGCMKEELPLTESQQNDKILFLLNIPTNTQVVTRASTVASEAELRIKQGYCLIYSDNSASSKPKLTYLFDIKKDIANNGTDSPRITIPKKTTIQSTDRVVFIFNTKFSGSGSFGDMLDDIQYGQISTKFPLIGKYGFETVIGDGIPMYGELTGFSSSGSAIQTTTIYRSVAKVQVKLKSPMTGSANNINSFTVANVKYQIFNIAITGNVNPGVGFDNLTTQALNSNDKNEAPKTDINGLAIDKKTVTTASNDNYTGANYIYEYHYSDNIIGATGSTNISINTPNKNRLAVILHNRADNRYYRLDLCNFGPKYIDIIRNHHYQIVINEINSDGYRSAEEALNGNASNIKYEIIDNTGATTISNGRYAISVGEELYANSSVTTTKTAPITVINNLRYILPAGTSLPNGVTSSIICIDYTTKNEIGSDIISLSTTTLTDVATPLVLTFIDKYYNGKIAFKITLGVLSYESDPITIMPPAEALSNCYMIPLGGKTLTIPAVDRSNSFWSALGDGNVPANVIGSTTEWYAEIIWADFNFNAGNKVAIKQNGATASDYGTGKYEGLEITIGALTKPGNVIIGIKKVGASANATNYLWSWHLWITDYNPDAANTASWATNTTFSTTGGQVHSYSDDSDISFWGGDYRGAVMMDRNLGATVSVATGVDIAHTTAGINAFGMHYQWGRKDPFPHAANANNNTISTWGKISTNMWPNAVNGTRTKSYSVNNPYKFITILGTPYDWQSTQDSESWKSKKGEKSIYDPCPAGWKVPKSEVWSNFNNTRRFRSFGTPSEMNYGRLYISNAVTTWYPAAGYRYFNQGELSGAGNVGVNWSSSTSRSKGVHLGFNNRVASNFANPNAYGLSVRCLKE